MLFRSRLDDGPAVDLKQIDRPPGVVQDGLELVVQDYASHKRLTLEYAPSKAGNVVGPWREEVVDLKPGCTTVDLIVAIGGGDAGPVDAPTKDALLAIDAPADGMADARADAFEARAEAAVVEASADGVLSPDVALDVQVVLPADGGVDAPAQPDVPAGPEGDAPLESATRVDLPVVVVVVDAPRAQDLASDAVPDAALDGLREVLAGPGPDVAPDRPADISQAGCVIESTPYASGAANPANACQTCQPAASGSTWTDASNGTVCASGQVCSVGICRLGCWLDGAFYPAAATKPGNACQYCNPTLSVSAWTNEDNGTNCGSGQVCNAGLCGTGCWISGTLYASGAANSANACQTCQTGTSDTAWTNSADGASCGAGQVCSSTTCQSGCWIDSTLYTGGATKPGNACQTCQPGVSVTAWSNAASTTACATGQVCTAGACQAGCSIGGIYYATDAANPSNACQVCKPGTTVALWTNLADGTGCGTGKVCSASNCQAGCWIDSSFRATGVTRPDNACQSCQPSVSGTAWTNVGDGTDCGNQQGCSAGVCGSGCWINSVFYTSGTAKSGNACQSCQPGTSTTAWTNVADSTGCGTGKVCYSGTCGNCVPGTTQCKDSSTQQICQANQTWLDNTPACTYGCNSSLGSCYPQCAPNALGCSSSTQPKQCDANGMWQNTTGCTTGKECVGAGNCLKSDGQSCGSTGECASGACTTFYVDNDGDGYTINPATFCGTAPPSGYVSSSLGTDCCDSDGNAHPGQTAYFTTPRIGCGGYDYNCVNGDEQQHGVCPNSSPNFCAPGCWKNVAPVCGVAGTSAASCICLSTLTGMPSTKYCGGDCSCCDSGTPYCVVNYTASAVQACH